MLKIRFIYLLNTLKNKLSGFDFFIKLQHWEFWNFYVVYGCVIAYYVWLSMRARTFFFFSASNPGIENGGFLGESKSTILKKIDPHWLPSYILIAPKFSITDVFKKIEETSLHYPIIVKPDVGERGRGIAKINSKEELLAYHQLIGVPYIIQEFIDFTIELGVFYYRMPNEVKGVISSVVMKSFLTIVGDGRSTLKQLIVNYPRARFQLNYLKEKFKNRLDDILPFGETLELEGIGNHCRGTTFLDGNYLINEQLIAVFDTISSKIDGFYFGRYDLRCHSIEKLYQGVDIKILELNGAGAEPAHIYQPGFSFWEGQKVLMQHWKILFDISRINHKSGIPYVSWANAMQALNSHKRNIQNIGI